MTKLCLRPEDVAPILGKSPKIAGANDSQLNAINKLTVIEADKDLRPVYEAVIREMLAAYRVNV